MHDPAEKPVITPVSEPAEATDGFELLQVPPGVASCKVVVPPTLTVVVPVIGAGAVFTVIDWNE